MTAQHSRLLRRRLARARHQLEQVRAWFNALDDVVIAMGDATPALIHAQHVEADRAFNDALNEQDAAEAALTASVVPGLAI